MGFVMVIIWLAIIVGIIAGMWKVFVKAGHPGWACIVPIYNVYIMILIAGRPVWWIVLLLIPFVSLVVLIVVSIDIAKRFGKTPGYGVGLALLGFIFYPMLGFSDATYDGSGTQN